MSRGTRSLVFTSFKSAVCVVPDVTAEDTGLARSYPTARISMLNLPGASLLAGKE